MNRSTTRRLRVIAPLAALALAASACGGGDSESEPSGSESSDSSGSESESADSGETFEAADCANGSTSADTFKVGSILPLTGNLAFLGPPEIAGVGLAVADVNSAGGAAGNDACFLSTDSGDTTDNSVGNGSANQLVDAQVSIAVGAAASGVTENVIGTFTDNEIVQISPANTATSLSGASDYYFRTAPPDTIQGGALGDLLIQDGRQRVAFIVFNDPYGTGLRNVVQQTVEDQGAEVVYGAEGDGDEFPPGQTTFSSEVTAALAAEPDAIVILAFDETASIIPELEAQGWDNANSYFSDGNLADYSDSFDPGVLEGAKGTLPGADAPDEFRDRVSSWYEDVEGSALDDFSYAAESYDAVILAALAATRGEGTDPNTIRENMRAVSGSEEGSEECTTYEECVALLEDGTEIQYRGPSGIGPINEDNDPSSAFIGIYQFDGDNVNQFQGAIEATSDEASQ